MNARAAHGLRLATAADRKPVAAMLARAFADDPAQRFLFPDRADRLKRMPRLFALLYAVDGPVGMRLMTNDGAAATLWRGPGQATSGFREMVRHGPAMLHALGPALRRGMRMAGAIEAHMPDFPFWYLHVAGCEPESQGTGRGAAVVRGGIERVAARRLPVYLETPLEANIDFYRKIGFEPTDDWRVPMGGPRFWSMLLKA